MTRTLLDWLSSLPRDQEASFQLPLGPPWLDSAAVSYVLNFSFVPCGQGKASGRSITLANCWSCVQSPLPGGREKYLAPSASSLGMCLYLLVTLTIRGPSIRRRVKTINKKTNNKQITTKPYYSLQ